MASENGRLAHKCARFLGGAGGFVAFSSAVGQGDPTRMAAQVVSGIGFLGDAEGL